MYKGKILKYVNHNTILTKGPMLLRTLALEHLLWELIHFSSMKKSF